jgi:purine-nucleoside phosphorylase
MTMEFPSESCFADWQLAALQTRQRAGLPDHWRADVGIVLGSGLGAAAERIAEGVGHELRMADIPGLAAPHVAGHRGRWLFGRCGDQRVIVQQGRIHSYEGHTATAITAHVRLMAAFGVRTLILTNAAGGIRRGFQPGDFMAIIDHLRMPMYAAPAWHQLASQAPHPWNQSLVQSLQTVPAKLRIHAGVYAMMPGPAYETPAEVRMLQTLGADAVGMSTIPEALAAAECGMAVLGLSCITNVASGLSSNALSHAEVTATALTVENELGKLLRKFLQQM